MDDNHKRILTDLEWVLNSPTLVAPSQEQFDFSSSEKLKVLESITLFNKYSGEIPVRLGRHFENLFEIALASVFPSAEIIRSLKLFEGKRTIGEIDFLLKRNHLPTMQIEIAVKFYLKLHQTGSLSDFVGPNKHDSLAAKLEKLRHHQQQKICDFAIDEHFFFLKGSLFYPFEELQESRIHYAELNPAHTRGFWVEMNNFSQLVSYYPDARFLAPLQKNQWISNCKLLPLEITPVPLEAFSRLEIVKPVYVALLSREKPVQEIARGFVLPSEWATS